MQVWKNNFKASQISIRASKMLDKDELLNKSWERILPGSHQEQIAQALKLHQRLVVGWHWLQKPYQNWKSAPCPQSLLSHCSHHSDKPKPDFHEASNDRKHAPTGISPHDFMSPYTSITLLFAAWSLVRPWLLKKVVQDEPMQGSKKVSKGKLKNIDWQQIEPRQH